MAAFVIGASGLLAAQNWYVFTLGNGEATVTTPCQMKQDDTRVPAKGLVGASTVHSLTCFSDVGDELYIAGWTDYDAGYTFNHDEELNASRDNTVKGIAGAVLLNSHPITFVGRRGLEFTANVQNARLLTSRVFVVGPRPYQVAVMTPIRSNHSFNIQRFLDSLRLPPGS